MEIAKSQVGNFMSSPLLFVRADYVLEQAEKVFQENRIVAAPVLVDKKTVLGVLTDFQLLKFFLFRNVKPSRARLQDFASELDPVVVVEQTDSIEVAFKLMIQSPSHRLYVADQGKLVGALSPRDLLAFLAGDTAIERHKEDQDLVAAKVRIKELLQELGRTRADLDQYQQVFRESPYMMHSVDLKGEIIMANPMLHYVLGYKDGELVGKTIYDLYPQQFHQQAKEGLAQIRAQGFLPFIHTLMVKKSKELIPIDIITAAKRDSLGDIVGTVTVGRLSDTGKMLEVLGLVTDRPLI